MPQEPLPVSPVWLSALPQDHKWYLSYEKCLRLESSDLKVSGCLPAEMSARILGYLLQEAPTDAGRDYIARAIDICVDTPALLQLAKNYLNSILKFCQFIPLKRSNTLSFGSLYFCSQNI